MQVNTAINTLSTLFSKTSANKISLQEAYEAVNRQEDPKRRDWIRHVLTDLKKYHLAAPLYAPSKTGKKLESIELTIEGQQALGRSKEVINTSASSDHNHINKSYKYNEEAISEALDTIMSWLQKHPLFTITLDPISKTLTLNSVTNHQVL